MKNSHASRSASDGFNGMFRSRSSVTLVECLVAMVIMTIGMLAAYLAYGQTLRTINSMWHTSRVNSAIRQEMEFIRTWNWATVNALSSTNFTNSVLNDVPSAVGTVDAEYYPTSTNAGMTMKKITVTVTWTDLNGVNREDMATTLFASNGLYTATE